MTFGCSTVRVDRINEIAGVVDETARSRVVRGTYGGVEVTFIGFDDLVKNKESTSRTNAKGDAEELIKTRDADGG